MTDHTWPLLSTCPHCNHEMDMVSSMKGGERPGAGDLTLCIRCGEWAIFADDKGTLRKPTDDEYVSFGTTAECQRIRAAWVAMTEVLNEFPPGGTKWTLLAPGMRISDLGFLPSFLHADDPRGAKAQISERYRFGAMWRSGDVSKAEIDDNNVMHYPGDPPFKPVATTKLRNELIVVYPSDFVAIIQPDRSFVMARLD